MTRYCGRVFTPEELEQIRALIKHNPKLNRTRISREVCRMFQWLKPDGKLKDMSWQLIDRAYHRILWISGRRELNFSHRSFGPG